MDESFDLPVHYKGEDILLPAHLEQIGYTHRIVVDVYGQEVCFEPDEEQNYRALIEEEKLKKEVNVELLKAISEAISTILK